MSKHVCPLCKGSLSYISGAEPSDDWEQRVAEHLEAVRQEAEGDKLIEPIPGIAKERLAKEKGQLWIHDESLSVCGYDNPQVGTVIKVQGKTRDIFFELAGRATRIVPKWGATEKLPGWWIVRIDSVEVPDSIPAEWTA